MYYKKYRKEQSSEGVIQAYKILLLVGGFFYFLYNVGGGKNFVFISIGIFVFLLITHVYTAIAHKNPCHVIFVLLLLIPNLIGALIGSLQLEKGRIELTSYFDNFSVWFLSNAILILSFGYLLIEVLKYKKEEEKTVLTVKLSTLLFYISTLVWNSLIYIVYILGWLDQATASYVFPWMVGTIFSC